VFVVKAVGFNWIPFWGTTRKKNGIIGDGEYESKEMVKKRSGNIRRKK
jgi:hypothetical protein